MIVLNNGLTEQERQKVERPYARNCRDGVIDYQRAGDSVATFVATHSEAFFNVGEMLDTAQTPGKNNN